MDLRPNGCDQEDDDVCIATIAPLMESTCVCGSLNCGPLPVGDPVLSDAVLHLVFLGSASQEARVFIRERSPVAAPEEAPEGSAGKDDSWVSSRLVADAVESLLNEAAAAATAASEHASTQSVTVNRSNGFSRQWVLDTWRHHLLQFFTPGKQGTPFLSSDASIIVPQGCRIEQLAALQALGSSLLQAAVGLARPPAAPPAPRVENDVSLGETAAQTASIHEARRSGADASMAVATHAALAVLYGQLCSWLLQQLLHQQQQLLLLERQLKGVEGRLQRLCRLLQRALALLQPLVRIVRSGQSKCNDSSYGSYTGATSCSSALFCSCWKAASKGERGQQDQRQEAHQLEGPGFAVALCFARRLLRALDHLVSPVSAASESAGIPLAVKGVAAEVSNVDSRCTHRLRQFVVFAAAEMPSKALLDSIEKGRDEDLLLLEGPLHHCIRTLLHPEVDGAAAVAAAEGLSWGLTSLGTLFWRLPCMQPVLSEGILRKQQQQKQDRLMWHLLQLMQHFPRGAFPFCNLFVQLLLDRLTLHEGPSEFEAPMEGSKHTQTHFCRSQVLTMLLQLLSEPMHEQETAELLLQRICSTVNTGANVTVSSLFASLDPGAKVALLRALLLQQHERAADCSDRGRKRCQAQQQPEQEKSWEGVSCCRYSSPEGQLLLQERFFRCIFALQEANPEKDDHSTLLMLQLWLQRAPHATLLQALRQNQQMLLHRVANEAMRWWQHPRRAVHTAARGVWALLQQRCSEDLSTGAARSRSSIHDPSDGSGRVDLLAALCKHLFCLPTASRKSLYQALATIIRALGAPRVLQLQPQLLEHLLSQLQNRPLRSAAMLALRALCEDLSEQDKQCQKQKESKQKPRSRQTCSLASSALRASLMGPVLHALSGNSFPDKSSLRTEQQQQQEEKVHPWKGPREYPLLVRVDLQAAGDEPLAEALAETLLPLLLRLEPSSAAPLLLALSMQLSLEEVEAGTPTEPEGAPALTPGGAVQLPPVGDHAVNAFISLDVTRPWSPGEAALLATARAAGIATWEHVEEPCRCSSKRMNPSDHLTSSLGTGRDCVGCRAKSSGFVCLVVRGCSGGGAPLCYRVSTHRLRSGLSSGQRHLRLRLLEALTQQQQATAAPRCEELQLLLFAAAQQLKLGSAAERSQASIKCTAVVLQTLGTYTCKGMAMRGKIAVVVAAFDRVNRRGRTAFRQQLAVATESHINALARKGCCVCRHEQHRSQPCVRHQQQEPQEKEQEAYGGDLACLLLYLQRLHSRCLVSCYPGAPPDRVLVALSLLLSLHSTWGPDDVSRQRNKLSTVAKGGTAMRSTNRGAEYTGCTVAAALGWQNADVRRQLLALLPVVTGPAPRTLLQRLLHLFPPESFSAAAAAPVSPQSQGELHYLEQHQCKQAKQYLHSKEQSHHQTLLSCSPMDYLARLKRSVWEAVQMVLSLRQDESAAGAVHLQLLLQELFATPLETLGAGNQCMQPDSAAPAAVAAAASSRLENFALQPQAAFCSALEESLREHLPAAFRHPPSTAAPNEVVNESSSNSSKDCSCHPAVSLLAALLVVTEAAEVRLAVIQQNPLALAEPKLGFHNVLGVLEICLASIEPWILRLPCWCSSSCSGGVCSKAARSWEEWQRRLLRLLQSTCCFLTSFAAVEAEEDEVLTHRDHDSCNKEESSAHAAEPGAIYEVIKQGRENLDPSGALERSSDSCNGMQLGQLKVDCRGHPVVCGEDMGEREQQQQLLAFCSWRAVKAATECLTAFFRAAAFGEESTEAATPPSGHLDNGKQAVRHYEPGQLQKWQQQPLLRLSIEEATSLGMNLISFLLSCRHMGAVEFLHEALGALCLRARRAASKTLQGLNRHWTDALLGLLLPTPDDSSWQEQRLHAPLQQRGHKQEVRHPKAPCSVADVSSSKICALLKSLNLPLRRWNGAPGLPPPLRKSKGIGLALIALIGLGQGTFGGSHERALLCHVLTCLLPLAEGCFEGLFFIPGEALRAQVHALNILKSLISASPEAAAADIRPVAAAAATALSVAQLPSPKSLLGTYVGSKEHMESTGRAVAFGAEHSTTHGDEFDTEGFSRQEERERGVPLAVGALALAIGAMASREFPVRSAANSLQVAATKRLAGTDDEAQRATAAMFSFCSGAALRSNAGAGSGLLSIDSASLSLPQIRPLIARALLPLMSNKFTANDSLQQQKDYYVVPQEAELLLRGLAARGPLRTLEIVSNSPEVGSPNLLVLREDVSMQGEAAVAVLLLLARADLTTLSSQQPPFETLLRESSVETVIAQLKAVAEEDTGSSNSKNNGERAFALALQQPICATTSAVYPGPCPYSPALRPSELNAACSGSSTSCGANSGYWLRVLLRALCCCLGSAPFASRALAARALASYILQRAQTHGPQSLVSAFQTVASAVTELLQRPEAPGLLEALRGPQGPLLFSQLRPSAILLQRAAVSHVPAMERVLVLQVLRALAHAAPKGPQHVLWAIASAASVEVMRLFPEGKTADWIFGGPSFVRHVGLTALQAVSLRIVVEWHLRSLYVPATEEASGAAVLLNDDDLDSVASALRASLELCVHPQVIEGAMLAVAEAASVCRRLQEQRMQLPMEVSVRGSGSGGLSVVFRSERLRDTVTPEVSEAVPHRTRGFVALWDICLGLLECPLGAAAGFATSSGSRRLSWQACYLVPLQVAACEALASLAVIAAPFERLCSALGGTRTQRAASAAAALRYTDSRNARAGASWSKLGAALLRCAGTQAARTAATEARRGIVSGKLQAANSALCSSSAQTVVCFSDPHNRWTATWSSTLLHCAQPTQELSIRTHAAEAIRISGLPSPCAAAPSEATSCMGVSCARAKLRVWRAVLLLLQDEDVTVREVAGTAASAAASELLSLLPSAVACTDNVQLLLAAAAIPAFSQEPHGLEAGCLYQLLLEVVSKVFPPYTVCQLLWRLLTKETCSSRESTGCQQKPRQQQEGAGANEQLFEEEPPNIYADPALTAQLAARNLLWLLLESQHLQQRNKTSEGHSSVKRQSVGLLSADGGDLAAQRSEGVRDAVVKATLESFKTRGASAVVLEDLRGAISTDGCWSSGRTSTSCSSRDAVKARCNTISSTSSEAEVPKAWLRKASEAAVAELHCILRDLRTSTAAASPKEVGACAVSIPVDADLREGIPLMIHPTQQRLFIRSHRALLCSWVLLLYELSLGRSLEDTSGDSLYGAAFALCLELGNVVDGRQTPQPQLAAIAKDLLELLNCLQNWKDSTGNAWLGWTAGCKTHTYTFTQSPKGTFAKRALEETALTDPPCSRAAAALTAGASQVPESESSCCCAPGAAAEAARRLAASSLFLLIEVSAAS
ncbi:hypothetical protein cyc_02842 [Cyclospora cayetanensis]|uniref:DUF2428 domain-containing protein n=1 Tax=Cyclospora cayetanensis TaxID=88456 RepID=A0A1D3CZI3_9EIME|nr:hypothetical protein cyc_02842 [Cyclospora cayetanensis]